MSHFTHHRQQRSGPEPGQTYFLFLNAIIVTVTGPFQPGGLKTWRADKIIRFYEITRPRLVLVRQILKNRLLIAMPMAIQFTPKKDIMLRPESCGAAHPRSKL